MPIKVTKKQIYNLKLTQDLFKICAGWKLEDIAKYSFLKTNTINNLYHNLQENKPFTANHKTIERIEDFIEENILIKSLECNDFKMKKNNEKTKYDFVLKNGDFEILGVKIKEMTYDSDNMLFFIKQGVCRCHLEKIYLAIKNEDYKKSLEKALVFKTKN